MESNSNSQSQAAVDADLHRLEVGLRQLKVQYDMYFAGALKLAPKELRAELEALVKRYSTRPVARYAQRFHFNALVSRFQCMCELWGKTLRSAEEGERRPVGAPEHLKLRERLLTRCLVRDPLAEQETLLRLHGRYAEATRQQGRTPVTFDRFVQGIVRQTGELRKAADCGQIELRLVVRDDEVRLTARPER